MSNQEIYNFNLDLPFGVHGENLLITNYNEHIGIVANILNEKYIILSTEMLNKTSVPYYGAYLTEINMDELDNLYRCELYANYKGNMYKVGQVSKHLQDVELYARPDHISEDEALGFEYNMNFRVTHKQVSKDEITGLYYSKTSILEKESRKGMSL